jgi:hypothetical protein
MQKWMIKLRPLACGGVTLGLLQAFQGIDLNQLWFNFWYFILNAVISLVLGGNVSSLANLTPSSQFGSFFS